MVKYNMSKAVEEYKTIYVPMDTYNYEIAITRGTLKRESTEPPTELVHVRRENILLREEVELLKRKIKELTKNN